ncbi:MAG: sirohydrochlorin chelatase [Planctomycetes bacterium]|nr:sirohydrochlorin chelatase [Planctomycetota bacterium]
MTRAYLPSRNGIRKNSRSSDGTIMSNAILFIGHGTRDPEGVAEFLRLVELCRERRSGVIVEHGFLELAEPSVSEGIERCATRGATAIQVLPSILLEAGHARRDVPAEIERGRQRFPDVEFQLATPLRLHPRIIDLCQLRIEQATCDIEPRDAQLLVVGRGSTEPSANDDVGRLAAVLGERLHFADASACFIDLARPALAEALVGTDCLVRLVVLSFLLFTGTLEKRIRRQIDEFAAIHASLKIIYAGYLNAHPLLLDAFLERGA